MSNIKKFVEMSNSIGFEKRLARVVDKHKIDISVPLEYWEILLEAVEDARVLALDQKEDYHTTTCLQTRGCHCKNSMGAGWLNRYEAKFGKLL